MAPHTNLNPRRALFVGLISCFGFVSAASQQAIGSEPATFMTGMDQRGATKLALAQVASANASKIADLPVAGTKLQGSLGRANPLWAIPLSSLTSTRERPLFSPTRRPPPVAKPAPMVQPAPPPSANRPFLALVGAIAGEKEGIAIFQDETTKNVIRMKTGESHSGWTLKQVKAREVTLQNGSMTAVLALPTPAAPYSKQSGVPNRQGTFLR